MYSVPILQQQAMKVYGRNEVNSTCSLPLHGKNVRSALHTTVTLPWEINPRLSLGVEAKKKFLSLEDM
jgi:hypothetical protein